MRQLTLPADSREQRQAVDRLVENAVGRGFDAYVRVLLARDQTRLERPWGLLCGRIDLAHPGDPPAALLRPKGQIRLLDERLKGDVFLERFKKAIDGAPLSIHEPIDGHGLDGSWLAFHVTHEWKDWGTAWPSVVLISMKPVQPRPFVSGVIEAEGESRVFAGPDDVIERVIDFKPSGGSGRDQRYMAFQIAIWDYRGRIDRVTISPSGRAIVQVTPANDPGLKLLARVEGSQTSGDLSKPGPSIEEVQFGGQFLGVNASLMVGDEVVDDATFDATIAATGGSAGNVEVATRSRLFLSWTAEDDAMARTFERHLAPLVRRGSIRLSTSRVEQGEDIESAVVRGVQEADVIVLLVSPDYLVSKEFDGVERRALHQRRLGKAEVIPVIVRPCAWQQTTLVELPALPSGGKPVSSTRNQDAAWLDVVKGIERAIRFPESTRALLPRRPSARGAPPARASTRRRLRPRAR